MRALRAVASFLPFESSEASKAKAPSLRSVATLACQSYQLCASYFATSLQPHIISPDRNRLLVLLLENRQRSNLNTAEMKLARVLLAVLLMLSAIASIAFAVAAVSSTTTTLTTITIVSTIVASSPPTVSPDAVLDYGGNWTFSNHSSCNATELEAAARRDTILSLVLGFGGTAYLVFWAAWSDSLWAKLVLVGLAIPPPAVGFPTISSTLLCRDPSRFSSKAALAELWIGFLKIFGPALSFFLTCTFGKPIKQKVQKWMRSGAQPQTEDPERQDQPIPQEAAQEATATGAGGHATEMANLEGGNRTGARERVIFSSEEGA